jgi:TRAP transporter TAXI family solute receptor
MKKLFAILLALCMVFALCACGSSTPAAPTSAPAEEAPAADAPAAPAPSANLTMGTGGEAGTYYAFGGVLGSYIGSNTDISINVVSSGGSAANLTGIMIDKIYDLATVQSDVMTYAYNGYNSFAEGGPLNTFRVLGGLYAETVQIVTCDPDIKSISDLAGKNVCVGDVGSGTYFNTVDILAAYGMSIDDINPVYQSFGDSTESLKDGKIDAAFTTAGAPTTSIVDLATAKSVYLVSIDDEHMAKILADCPWYASYTIPAGTYSGLDVDTVTVTVKATLVCRADLPDDVAYAIVSTIYNNAEAITALHAKGAELSLDFATDGIAVPFHPGAAKFFSENGITVDTGA